MASITTRPNGHRWITFTHPADRRRRTLRLGKARKRDAESVRAHVETLAAAIAAGREPPAEAVAWLGRLPCEMLARVAAVGLCPAERRRDVEPATVAGVLDAIMDDKCGDLKASSMRKNSRRSTSWSPTSAAMPAWPR